jgi:HAD superfamily 5'-nucleotidase-like hydrolase
VSQVVASAGRTGVPPEREVYTNRTLNLRAIRAVGYDLDYTLVHYNAEEWERRAYERMRVMLRGRGWPVDELKFNPELVIRGLIIDRELGNLIKANRFGYVKAAAHGTRLMEFDEQRETYSTTIVDLAEERYAFLNTLFSLSEAAMMSQLVDLLDAGKLPEVLGYSDLHDRVRSSLDEAHMEGQLKAEIVADPERFVERDPDAALALMDQQASGKRLVLITNSDWDYTRFMMSYAYDPYLPPGQTWRDLFELVIVSARKPEFFWTTSAAFRVVTEDGLLRPSPAGIVEPGVYVGGCASMVERYLNLNGANILYVGDHIYGDVQVSKRIRRWRTALILRELEAEMAAVLSFRPRQLRLAQLMERKTQVELEYSQARLSLMRVSEGYGPPTQPTDPDPQRVMMSARAALVEIDLEVAELAKASAELHNRRWGLLMRTGNDKSHLARQIERHADVYTSRVSNFLAATPFVYLRSPRGSLPHDPGLTAEPLAAEPDATTAEPRTAQVAPAGAPSS